MSFQVRVNFKSL